MTTQLETRQARYGRLLIADLPGQPARWTEVTVREEGDRTRYCLGGVWADVPEGLDSKVNWCPTTHLADGVVVREPGDWWTVILGEKHERGCGYGVGHLDWVGNFSRPHAELLARAVRGRVRELEDARGLSDPSRRFQVVRGLGVEGSQEIDAPDLDKE